MITLTNLLKTRLDLAAYTALNHIQSVAQISEFSSFFIFFFQLLKTLLTSRRSIFTLNDTNNPRHGGHRSFVATHAVALN